MGLADRGADWWWVVHHRPCFRLYFIAIDVDSIIPFTLRRLHAAPTKIGGQGGSL